MCVASLFSTERIAVTCMRDIIGFLLKFFFLSIITCSCLACSSFRNLNVYTQSDKNHIVLQGGHHKPLSRVVFSSSGRLVATAGYDKVVKIWDSRSRTVIANLRGHTRGVFGLSFSSDESLLASSDLDGFIRIWDMNTFQQRHLMTAGNNSIGRLLFIPESNQLISAGDDAVIRIWSVLHGKQIAELKGHRDPILGLALTPDGRYLYSAGFDKQIIYWDLNTRNHINSWSVPGAVSQIALSPDGKLLAVAMLNQQAIMLKSDTGNTQLILTDFKSGVSDIAFSPLNRQFATACLDGSLQLWDITTGQTLGTMRPSNPDKLTALAYDPAQPYQIWTGGWFNNLWIWDTERKELLENIQGNYSPLFSLAISDDGRYLAAGSQNTGVYIWNIQTDKNFEPGFSLNRVEKISEPVWSLDTHDSRLVYGTGQSALIRVLDILDTSFNQSILIEDFIPSKIIRYLAVSPDGRYIAVYGDDCVILLRTADSAILKKCKFDASESSNLIFHPSGKQLLVVDKGQIALLSLDDDPGQCQSVTKMRIDVKGTIRKFTLSPDKRFLAVVDDKGTLQVHTTPSVNKESRLLFNWQITTLEGRPISATAISFSPDGHDLLIGTSLGEIIDYPLLDQFPKARIQAHYEAVNDLKISPDGRFVYSAGEDTVVKVWRLPNLTPVATLAAGQDGKAYVLTTTEY